MRAAYDKIYRELKSQIEDGTYGYEVFLPSQAVLVKRFDCAHNTVRKALAMLAAEGYCQPIHGKGVRVIWRPQDTHSAFTLGGIEPFADTARRNDLDGGTQVKVFEHLVCDEQLAALSGFAVGTELLHVERIRFLDDQALIHDKEYYDAVTVGDLSPEQAALSIFSYLEEKRGVRITTSKRTITMELATDEDRAWLDIDGIDYLAVMAKQTFDGNGHMFNYTQSRHHPSHFRFQLTALRQR